MYRQVYYVRCNFDDEQFHQPSDEFKSRESITSLYLRDDMILIEVILYKDRSQVSIASEVPATELFFGEEPTQIPFRDRISILNRMMEKFFIISDPN